MPNCNMISYWRSEIFRKYPKIKHGQEELKNIQIHSGTAVSIHERQVEETITHNVEPFSGAELQSADNSMKEGMTSGIDGIPSEVIKKAVGTIPMWLLCRMNRLLRDQESPCDLKLPKIVLILNLGKSNKDPL